MRKIPTRLRGTNFCTSSARFAPSFVRQPNGPERTQIVQTHQNISLWSNGAYRVRSLRKILRRLLGTNFCTSSARFASSFVGQPNGPECTKIVRNASKHQFRVPWGGLGVFVAKNSHPTSWHELLHLAYFAPSFVKQPNGPRCTQIVRNAPKRQFWSNEVDQVRSLQKLPTRLCGTNFFSSSAHFAPNSVRQLNGPKCTQIIGNVP